MRQKQDISLVFMLSNWYSGATLLALLLDNHSKISCNGETFPFEAPDLYTCSCGSRLLDCDFYTTAAAHMLDRKKRQWSHETFRVFPLFSKIGILNRWFTSYRHLYKSRDFFVSAIPSFRARINRFVLSHIEFFIQTCKYDNTSIYVDGTKYVRRMELFAKYSSHPIKVIFIVRDGRGFCKSYLGNKRNAGKSLLDAATAWMRYIEDVDILTRRFPNIPVMPIRYEDICRDFDTTFLKIYRFLGIQNENLKIKENEKLHHVLGNKMRKQFDGVIKEDLSWKTVLTAKEITVLTDAMRTDLVRFGYI